MKEPWKYPYEEFFRYHEFSPWLAEGETVSTPAVIVTERDTGDDKSSSMVSDVGPYGTTKARYMLKAGEKGKYYNIAIQITTSNNQKFEDRLQLQVI